MSKVDPMYLFSADFQAAARADLFIFFSLPSGSTCASSGKILAAELPTREKGHFSSRAGGSAARIFLEAISSPPSHFSPNVVRIRSCCTKRNADYNFFATKILLG